MLGNMFILADKRAKILEKAKGLARHWESSLSSSKVGISLCNNNIEMVHLLL